jgi:hypothetical protein
LHTLEEGLVDELAVLLGDKHIEVSGIVCQDQRKKDAGFLVSTRLDLWFPLMV